MLEWQARAMVYLERLAIEAGAPCPDSYHYK